jgi:hypothetical protein
MSCGHGWHGCGPWYGPPYASGWYEPADWYEEAGPPFRGRRRYRRFEREAPADELEARLADLRDEVRRVESELSELRRREDAAAEGP